MSYVPPINREIKDFYKDHVDALYRSCCFLTGGQGDAEEMVKTVFLRLLAKGLEFSSDRDARAWMILESYKLTKHPPKTRTLPVPVEPVPATVEAIPPAVVEPVTEEAAQEPSCTEALPVAETPAALEENEVPVEEMEETAEENKASMEEEETAEEEIEPLVEESSAEDPEVPAEAEAPSAVSPEQPEEAPASLPESVAAEAAEDSAQKADVFAEIRKLSYKNRLVALLYYCEGYRKSEIAAYLGCPEFRIRSRLRRVAKLVQDDMGGEEEC